MSTSDQSSGLLSLPNLLRQDILRTLAECAPCRRTHCVKEFLQAPIHMTETGPSLTAHQVSEALQQVISCEQMCPAMTSALALYTHLRDLEAQYPIAL